MVSVREPPDHHHHHHLHKIVAISKVHSARGGHDEMRPVVPLEGAHLATGEGEQGAGVSWGSVVLIDPRVRDGEGVGGKDGSGERRRRPEKGNKALKSGGSGEEGGIKPSKGLKFQTDSSGESNGGMRMPRMRPQQHYASPRRLTSLGMTDGASPRRRDAAYLSPRRLDPIGSEGVPLTGVPLTQPVQQEGGVGAGGGKVESNFMRSKRLLQETRQEAEEVSKVCRAQQMHSGPFEKQQRFLDKQKRFKQKRFLNKDFLINKRGF